MKVSTQIRKKRRTCKRKELNTSRHTFSRRDEQLAITVDLVFQARAKLSNNKVSGPADAIVSEMIKALSCRERLCHCRMFPTKI